MRLVDKEIRIMSFLDQSQHSSAISISELTTIGRERSNFSSEPTFAFLDFLYKFCFVFRQRNHAFSG